MAKLYPKTRSRASVKTINKAVRILKKGGLVAFPTETVYGLGADALNAQAVAKIFEVKKRPSFDPIIVHVSGIRQAKKLWKKVPPAATALIEKFWPGPLTLVLPKTKKVPNIVTAGLDTVAVRMPNHPVALDLIRCLGRPIAAPSANVFGRTSPTTAQAVKENLGKKVDLILDGGPCNVGLESTVIKIEKGKATLLRPGGISVEEIKKFIPIVTARCERLLQPTPRVCRSEALTRRAAMDPERAKRVEGERAESPSSIFLGGENRTSERRHTLGVGWSGFESPGQLPSHYAPKTPLRLMDKSYTKFLQELKTAFAQSRKTHTRWLRIGLLSFDKKPKSQYFEVIEVLSPKRNLTEAAANLFEAMRRLDKMNLDFIVAERVPKKGLGLAIADRLERASAGRLGMIKKIRRRGFINILK